MPDVNMTIDGVSNGTPIPDRIRTYTTRATDSFSATFRVYVDKNGDVLIDEIALDILLRGAGFQEIKP